MACQAKITELEEVFYFFTKTIESGTSSSIFLFPFGSNLGNHVSK